MEEENPTKLKLSNREDLRNQVPQAPARSQTLRRVNFTKPKSRFTEINHPLTPKPIPESEEFQASDPDDSPSSTDEDDEEWRDEQNKILTNYRAKKRRRINRRALIEWTLFLIITACLICSLTVKSLKNEVKWGLKIWKWCVMVMVIFCGRLVSGWLMGLVVFLIERNFMLREKVLYFVYGLRKSIQNCLWLALVLMAWMTMFPNVNHHDIVVKKVFRVLIAVLIGAIIWLLKIVLVKVLASSFHVATFFDRMKESVFHHYVLEALSGPPLDEEAREQGHHLGRSKTLPARWREGRAGALGKSKKMGGSRRIDMEKLKKLSMGSRRSAWSVKRLVSYVRRSGLSTISRTVDDFGKAESEITSEWEARSCAQRIFKNVAKPGAK